MGKTGTGMNSASAYLSVEKIAYVQARADRIQWTRTKYMGAIVDYWIKAGCPNVDAVENSFPPLPYHGPKPAFGRMEQGTPPTGFKKTRKGSHKPSTEPEFQR